MKKFRFLIPLVALGMLSSCGASGLPVDYDPTDVGIDTPWEEYSIPIEEVNFPEDEYDLVLKVGESYTYHFTYAPKNATPSALNWIISDPEVISVEKDLLGYGVVTGIAPGKATITVTGGDDALFDPIMLDVRVDIPLDSYQVTTTSLNLDFGQSAPIEATFTPATTTQKDLHYTVAQGGETLISISDYGVVTALEEEGNTTVTVSSDFNSATYQVSVTVTDKYTYLSDFAVTAPSNKLEINQSMNLGVTMLPANHSANLEDVRYHTSTPEILAIDEVTGEVKGLAVGTGKVSVSVPERGGEKISEEITITVFEVKINSMSLGADSKQTINLGNKGTTSHQLVATYTVDDTGYTEPSIKDIVYTAEPAGVVTVSNTGLIEIVGPGSAKVTVMDNHSGKSDYCNVNVTINATAVTISSDRISLFTDEIATLTATTVPAKISNNIDWDVPAKLVIDHQEGNTLKVHSTEVGTFNIKATVDGITSNEVSIEFKYRAGEFLANKFYVVGSSDFSSGTSTAGESWGDSNKAFMLNEPLPADPENELDFQVRGSVTFEAGDEFKIRSVNFHQNIVWKDSVRENHYEIKESLADKVVIMDGETAGDSYGNFQVLEAGTYRILYKVYRLGQETEWATVYIDQKETLNVDKTSLNLFVGNETTLKVSDWDGTLNFVVGDDTIISAVDLEGHGLYTISALKEGSTTISISDNSKTLDPIPVTVSKINLRNIYLDANGMFDSDNVSMFVHAWDDNGQTDYKLVPVEGSEGLYTAAINEAYTNVIFTRGPEGAATLEWDFIYNQTPDMTIPEGMNLWKMTEWIEGVPVGDWMLYTPVINEFYLTPNEVTLTVGQSVNITAHNNKAAVTYSSDTPLVAYVSNEGEIHALAKGEATITGFDGTSHATVKVTVNEAPVINYKAVYVNAYGHLDLDDAVLFVHAWDENGGEDYKLSLAAGQTIVYTAQINEAYDHIKVIRCAVGAENVDWPNQEQGKAGNVWNVSADLELPADKDMWVFSKYEDGFAVGTFEVYDKDHHYVVPVTPETKTKIYLDISEITWWANDDIAYAYLYGESGNAGDWPGCKMELVTPTLLCVEITDIENYASVIFLRYGDGQTYNRSSKDGGIAIVLPADYSVANTWKFNSGFANGGEAGVGYGDGNYSGEWTLTQEN